MYWQNICFYGLKDRIRLLYFLIKKKGYWFVLILGERI